MSLAGLRVLTPPLSTCPLGTSPDFGTEVATGLQQDYGYGRDTPPTYSVTMTRLGVCRVDG